VTDGQNVVLLPTVAEEVPTQSLSVTVGPSEANQSDPSANVFNIRRPRTDQRRIKPMETEVWTAILHLDDVLSWSRLVRASRAAGLLAASVTAPPPAASVTASTPPDRDFGASRRRKWPPKRANAATPCNSTREYTI
jgi:hypothetical protein